MTEQPLLTAKDGDVFILTLNRPDRLNAISIDMLKQAGEAVERAVAEGARALVLTGAGRAFCSGADLQGGDARSGAADMGAGIEAGVNPLLERLFNLSIPIVTAVNGAAAGAGAGLALSGDFVVMGRSAYLLLAFVNIGLVPDAGLSFLLPRLVGRQRALQIMMLGERVPAEMAEAWGLIYKTVDDSALFEETIALARRLAAGPTRAYGLIRRNMRRSLDSSLTETLRAEREAQREAGYTQDFDEGVASFVEKRRPVFKGC